MVIRKKQLTVGIWMVPALMMTMGLSGCMYFAFPEEPMYVDWTKRNVAYDFRPAREMRVRGETFNLVTLSDGGDAIELSCVAPWHRALSFESGLSVVQRAAIEQASFNEHVGTMRNGCLQKALQVCRVHTWNGNTRIALMQAYTAWRTGGVGSLIYVRCLHPRAYWKWMNRASESAPAPSVK
jgi:hypothetical protein